MFNHVYYCLVYYMDAIFYDLEYYQDMQDYLKYLSTDPYEELGWQVG